MNPIQMSRVEFEMGDSIYCFDEISPAKYGLSYRINGFGDLTWNNDTDKEGFGFAVGIEGDYRNLMYFTEEEMRDHFIHTYEMIKIKSRDNKINKLLDLDKYN